MTRKSCHGFVCVSGNQIATNFAGCALIICVCLFVTMLLVAAKTANADANEDLAAQLKTAAAYHEQADYPRSISILKRIVQRSPRNYLANLLLGEDLLHSGNTSESIAPLEVACQMRPQDATAEVFLADAAATLGDYPTASDALQTAIARSGGTEPFLEAWASYCLERYRILELSLRATKGGEAVALRVEASSHREGSESRESLLHESAVADPEQPGIWGELGIAQLELGKHTEMAESLKTAQEREPQGTETLQLEALLAAAEQNWPEAEKQLTVLGARSPAEFRSGLALWQHMLVQRPESGGRFAQCLRNPRAPCASAPVQIKSGAGVNAKELYAEGRWEQLIALPKPAAANSSGWLWRGVAFVKTENCRAAIPALERGITADELVAGFWLELCYSSETERTAARLSTEKDQAAFHRLHGDVLLRLQHNGPAARAEYEEALKTQPRDPLLLERLSEAQLRVGDLAAARQSAQSALLIDPHQWDAMHILVQIAMDNRDYEQALPWLRRLAAANPGDGEVVVDLARALAQTGEPAEALHWLAPALARGYPDENGASHALMANLLRKLGRDAEAAQADAEGRRLSDAYQSRSIR